MHCNEVDILADNSFGTSCENKMSPDEADIDLDLQDKLVTAEVEKFHSLYEGVEDKTIPVSNIAESQADLA